MISDIKIVSTDGDGFPPRFEIVEFSSKYSDPALVDFCEFLSLHSGARIDPEYFAFGASDYAPASMSGVQFTFSLVPKSQYNIYGMADLYEGRLPSEAIPFAIDGGGNLLLCYFKGDKVGQIWFWDHDSEDGNPDAAKNCHFVSTDFRSFLESLMTMDEFEAALAQ
ncbi:SMI1/KNR4 family protein [Pseudomonas syringae pv. actinidiae]|nr:SMI1/KNR4 family protein [Pseudomonas syringae pv. actinidiae]